ncbi:MAG TPA: hypothetical protein VFP50_19415 [Anaeromyxobacteraceae bacterium]|nr:hypothetical protein [Anaeromyxobacteraceae bacterium]
MNDDFRELKARVRRLHEVLETRGVGHMAFAQAVSAVARATRDGDRTRTPPPELLGLLEKAEQLGRALEPG